VALVSEESYQVEGAPGPSLLGTGDVRDQPGCRKGFENPRG